MDAFYASVEQRDHPELRGKPVAVGGSGDRGVVAAASYEARRYGVRSAMASRTARSKCPQLVFVKPRFEVYKQVSNQIRAIFAEYTPLIEPLSLDEAYLDVTENLRQMKSATRIAEEIKQRIKEQTRLTASAGVSFNKFLAKLASDYKKPDGLFVIKPEEGEGFVAQLSVDRFHGIGRVTAQRMHEMGILTGYDLRQRSEEFLIHHFGKAGRHYYRIARAEDPRPVEPDRIRKSVGSENTFERDLDTLAEMQSGLLPLLEEVWNWCTRTRIYGRTVTIKIKLNDFQVLTRSRSTFLPIQDKAFFDVLAFELLEANHPYPLPVRLLGVSLSNLDDSQPYEGKQLTMAF
jgi:DNA polymerase IV